MGLFWWALRPILNRRNHCPAYRNGLAVLASQWNGDATRCECLRFIYTGVGHVYAPFTFNQLYFHQKLVARFTHPEMVTKL